MDSRMTILLADDYDRTCLPRLIEKFHEEANEHDVSVNWSISRFKYAIVNRLAWYIRIGSVLVGYFFAEVQANDIGKSVLVIHQLYVDNQVGTEKRLIKRIDAVLVEAAKENNIRRLGFYTRRNPWAFCRHIGTKWKVDSHVLHRTI